MKNRSPQNCGFSLTPIAIRSVRLSFVARQAIHCSYPNLSRRIFRPVFFLLIFFPMSIFGQSNVKICGCVLDAETSQPLAGANVQVLGSALGAATDAGGYFQIENLLNGEYAIKADYIGYESVTQHVFVADGPPVDLSIKLERRVLEFEGVSVTATRSDERAANVIVLTRRDIERLQASTIAELVSHVPGVQVQDAGVHGGKISIRGSEANQVLVLLDGVKLNDEMTGEVDLSTIPTHAIERVEIRKGSASSAFGGGAMAGVLNIFSSQTADDNVRLAVRAGSYGFLNVEPTLAARWRNVNALFSFQSMRSSGTFPFAMVHADDRIEYLERQNADVWSRNFYGQLGYTRKKHQLAVRYQRFASERGQPGPLYNLTPFARSGLKREICGGDYRYTADDLSLFVQGAVARHESESTNLMPPISDIAFGSTPPFHFYTDLKTSQLKAELKLGSFAWLSNKLGAEIKLLRFTDENRLTTQRTPIGQAEDESFAGFFRQEYRFEVLSFDTHFSPAIRYDGARFKSAQNRRSEDQWSPQLDVFLSCGSMNKLFLAFSIGRAFRMPTFADLFYQDFRVQGKPDLLPEKSLNRQVSVGSQFTALGQWRFEMTVFRHTVTDMIVWRLGSYEFFRPYNTNAEITGAEYSLDYSVFADFLELTASYAHLQPLNKNENITLYDRVLPYRPQHSFTAATDINYANWHTSLLFRSVGERFITEANTKVMPPYAVLDWTANWRLTFGKIKSELQLAIYNVTDEDYQILRDMPLPGREWRMGVRLSR
ncbi:TonB-dependent receptor [candidate division KSB1 bacterium]|nr:TonB-dependent receptor [candidate division KSB1 bacterium]